MGDSLTKGKLITPLAAAVPPRKVKLIPTLRARNATTINLLVIGICKLYNDNTISIIKKSKLIHPNTNPAIGNHDGIPSFLDAFLAMSTEGVASTGSVSPIAFRIAFLDFWTLST